jgi:hypothetical protein
VAQHQRLAGTAAHEYRAQLNLLHALFRSGDSRLC